MKWFSMNTSKDDVPSEPCSVLMGERHFVVDGYAIGREFYEIDFNPDSFSPDGGYYNFGNAGPMGWRQFSRNMYRGGFCVVARLG